MLGILGIVVIFFVILGFSRREKSYAIVDEKQRREHWKNKEKQRREQQGKEVEQKQKSFEQEQKYYIQDKKRYQQYLKRKNRKQLPIKLSETDLIRAFAYRRAENLRLVTGKKYSVEEGPEYIQLLDRNGNSFGARFISHYKLN